MRKITKWLLIAVAAVSLGWSGLISLYTHAVSEELATLRRESRGDVIYLRCRIRELESELTAGLLENLTPKAEPVGGDGETETRTESTLPTEPSAESAAKPSTGEVTLPTHQAPETQSPSETQAETVPALYLVAERDGVIGLFDASGELLREANVFVMTLPAADREALTVGIPCRSWEEAVELLERYE